MYPVSTLLRAGGLDPADVAAACGLERVDRVPVRAAPRWMRVLWIGPVAATTLPWAVYVRHDVLTGDPVRLARLLVHELVHVRQWQRLGPLRFLGRYLGDYARGRLRGLTHHAAYHSISLEREARELESP